MTVDVDEKVEGAPSGDGDAVDSRVAWLKSQGVEVTETPDEDEAEAGTAIDAAIDAHEDLPDEDTEDGGSEDSDEEPENVATGDEGTGETVGIVDEDGAAIEVDGRPVTAADFADPERGKKLAKILKAGVNPSAALAEATGKWQEVAAVKRDRDALAERTAVLTARNQELELAALGDEPAPRYAPEPKLHDFWDESLGDYDTQKHRLAMLAWLDGQPKWKRDVLDPYALRQEQRKQARTAKARELSESQTAFQKTAQERHAQFSREAEEFEQTIEPTLKLTEDEGKALKTMALATIQADVAAGRIPSVKNALMFAAKEVENRRLQEQVKTATKDVAASVKRSAARAADAPAGGKRTGMADGDVALPRTQREAMALVTEGKMTEEQFDRLDMRKLRAGGDTLDKWLRK